MEQKENPVDAGTSVPDKENPYADLNTILIDKSTLDTLRVFGGAVQNARGELFDAGFTRSSSGVYLTLLFSGKEGVKNPFAIDKCAIPDTVQIPYFVMLDLMRAMRDISTSIIVTTEFADRVCSIISEQKVIDEMGKAMHDLLAVDDQ